MKIEVEKLAPIETFSYQVVAQGGRDKYGKRVLQNEELPIFLGSIRDSKIEGIEFIVVASDLQGHVFKNKQPKLLGETLPEFLALLFEIEFPQVNRQKVGVFLCGDLFARTDKRGGLGDVRNVWRAFNSHFGFVVGVAGNHDDFGEAKEFRDFTQEEDIYYLHNQVKKVRGLKIGGISGIIGKPSKPFRNEESKHLKELKKLLLKQADFILLHEGPSYNNFEQELQGNDKIRKMLELSPKNTIFCGHNHWNILMVEMENGTQILNLDAKCVLLKVEK